jgi:aminocarboxymuconate-semialdehyde decarboxylase
VHAMPTGESKLPMAARGTYMVGLEGATAATSLVTSGTAGKCPDLRICFSHGAGGYPLMLPRAQYFWSGAWNEEPVVPDRAIMHDDGPSPIQYARRFYYDSLVFDRRALRYLVDLLGSDRLLVGSDFPAMAREDPAGRTLRSLDLPPDQLADITWNNAFRWLGISPVR